MEKCLATPELRYSVFTFLRSMDLFNCAQVCKSWKDDALNVRWRYCSVGMRQLMSQLAAMEEEEEYACYYNRLQTSLEEFDKDRWQTFLRLTSKVQVLSISTFLLHRDSVELVNELIAIYGGPLFPSLWRFDIYGDWRMPPMIAFSLVPGLTSVMIDGMEPYSDYDGFEEIFALVSENCKGIKDLELRPKCALFAPSFSAFPELRTLTYWSGPLFVESWNSLASCKSLAELKLLFPDLGEVADDLLEEDLEFGALRQLYIFGMDRETAVALLGGTRMPVLHTLRLEEVEFTEEEKKDLTENLKARCPALKRIDFVSKANENTRFALCGVLGLLLHDQDGQAAPEICEGLSLLQHRGQDACGIVTCGAKGRLNQCKANGMVRDVFDPNSLSTLVGAMGIGHVRYPTAGSSAHSEAQPFYVNSPYGIVFAHNGNLINTADLKFFLDHEAHRHINTDSDSELLLNIFANNLQKTGKFRINEEDIFTAIGDLMHQCKGAYACVAMLAGFGIIAFRDPNGIRPVGMGRRRTPNGGYDCIVASESVVADAGGFGEWEDVRAGEAIIITRSSVSRRHLVPDRAFAPDIFEYVYFARPDSVLDGVSVYRSRMAMGENLAAEVERVLKEKDIKVDVVIPVPDTSRVSALELAQRLGLPYREGFVKNRYVGRTFIMPGQQMRKKNVRRKLNAMALEFANKVVLLVDDSIVRGTTSKEIIQMAKDVGAKKVIFASCAPPIRYSNVYGIDMPSRSELVAYERSEDEIAKALGADVVIYQTLPDLVKSVTQFNPGLTRFDCSVFDGVYVTGDVQEEYFAHLEQLRNDSAKIKQMSKGMSLPPEEVASLDNDHARGRIVNGTNGVNGGPYEVHEEPLGCSGPMNGADDTVGLYNSWSVAASSKSRERSQGRSDIGGLSNFRTFST